ncbi:MAG: 3-hydroxybutyrate dehydrogenase [Proteobacteria bacterium]|nr:MAG: 3-hydroxybutyrate dehydrogenase [Pseudomonadota bacterium]
MLKKYLDGKVALVTGSSSGIGFGIAESLAAEGATILLHGLEPQTKLEEIAQDLRHRFDIKVVAYSVNLADRPAMDAFLTTLGELPRLDILVNNAGLQFTAPVESFPKEKWDLLLQLHLTAPFELMQVALPKMREQGWGRVVQVASVHGLVGSKEKAAYVAAKHGIIGLTKVAALETAGTGVTINAVCPGWVKTPLVEAQITARSAKEGVSIEKATEELLAEKQPSKKFTETSDLGALVVFLCSAGANNLTGASLPVDGGWTAQ